MTLSCFPRNLILACMLLGITLLNPAAAIQNIGFPDDQRLVVGKADLSQFQMAQKALHNALITLLKFDGVDGESKGRDAALNAISTNAQIIEGIAKRAGNKDVVTFMATLKSWSTSGDADDRAPKLVKQIEASLLGLMVEIK
ncbi:hypothetical protein [Pararhizobium sp. IMCC21322]|uniref:hypothetical protein n=1 Tax=Pararhizobium sp. IMCC21322 TaxID=3067903 RepID=UPI0027406BB0|nr:hypothetical protein [Pararhizobium sp. IMCC21322]